MKVLAGELNNWLDVKFKVYWETKTQDVTFKINNQVIEKKGIAYTKNYATIVFDPKKNEYKVTGMQSSIQAGSKHYEKQVTKYKEVMAIMI